MLQIPPVSFNHLYIVLDTRTYRAILASDFLRTAFPGIEQRATLTSTGETWSGAYFYCQDTYLELFGSGNKPIPGSSEQTGHWQAGAAEGWAGLAFSTQQPGGSDIVREAYTDAFQHEPFHELRKLRANEETINWFYTVRLADQLGLGSFESWLMEYHPAIFAHKGIPLPESGELTTRAYLSAWNKERVIPIAADVNGKHNAGKPTAAPSPGPLPPPQPIFSNLIGATIHMDARRAELFAGVLTLLGYAKSVRDDILVLEKEDFTLQIYPTSAAPTGYRLSALRLAMSRPSVAPMTFLFAPTSRLLLNEDQTADWFFGK